MCRRRIPTLTGSRSQLTYSWQTKIKPHAITKISYKPVSIYIYIYIYIYIHIHTNTSIPGSATNQSLENGVNHMYAMEYPSDHKISHSSEFSFTSNITWLVTWLSADFISTKTQQFNIIILGLDHDRYLFLYCIFTGIIFILDHNKYFAFHFALILLGKAWIHLFSPTSYE